MALQPRVRPLERAALAVAVAAILSSCGGSSPTPVANPPTPSGPPTVTGTERLAWRQAGDASGLRFLMYVDGGPVALDATTCNGTATEAECSTALPPLTDGTHTLALAARSAVSGAEGPRSEPITVQKVSGRSVVSAASLPDARAASAGPGLQATVSTSDGRAFAADVVARALKGPMQLASMPDGRVLVADGDGLVRVVHPGELDHVVVLDPRTLLRPHPAGPMGLALHPEFARNHFVYVSFLADEGPEPRRLHIVRLRQVGDTLGEPATIFTAPLLTVSPVARDADRAGTRINGVSAVAPGLAFGPDGLLYVLLPPAYEFDGEPAASRPNASMLRLTDDGRAPDSGRLSGVVSHSLGFAWHPASGVLWGVLAGAGDEAEVRPVADVGATSNLTGRAAISVVGDAGREPEALVMRDPGALQLARTFADGFDPEWRGVIRLSVPILVDNMLDGFSGRVLDVVAGDGTVYLAMESAGQTSGAGADRSGFIVRLRLRSP